MVPDLGSCADLNLGAQRQLSAPALTPLCTPKSCRGVNRTSVTAGGKGRAALHWERRLVLAAHGLNPPSSKSCVQSQNNSAVHNCLPRAQPLPDPSSPGVFLAGVQLPSLGQHLELQNPRQMLHKEQRNVELGRTPRVLLQGVPAPACSQQPPHHPQPGQTCPLFPFDVVQLQFRTGKNWEVFSLFRVQNTILPAAASSHTLTP